LEKRIRVAVIGAGAVARRGHLPALKASKGIEVKVVVDVDESLARKVAEEFDVPEFSTQYHPVLERNDIDLIDVCTPTDTHVGIIMDAAAAGKHILVEKPLTVSIDDALKVYHAVKKHNVKLNVVQNWRYFPGVQAAKERIDKGYLGEVASIEGVALTKFPSSWTRNTWLYHFGGALFDFAPHLIDMVLWFKGRDVVRVCAMGGDFTGGDMGFINNAQILLEFDDRTTACCTVSFVAEVFNFNLNVHGTGGDVSVDVRGNFQHEVHGSITPLDEVRRFTKKMYITARDILSRDLFKGAMAYYKPLIEDFRRSILEGLPEPVPVRHGTMVTAVLDAAGRSISSGNIIELSRELNGLGVGNRE
jgi:predicted dehydrogenase